MRVERLRLQNFRNIRDSEFNPAEGLNFIIGSNGQGKTSFLEALGFMATLRSFRGSKSAEIIRWGELKAQVECSLKIQDYETVLDLGFTRSDPLEKRTSKTARINGKSYNSSTQYLSQRFGSYQLGFHAVIFNPSDHELIRGEPSGRRSFIDRVLAAEDINYLKTLQRYQRLLDQRNTLLKAGEPNPESKNVLRGFTEPLAECAAQLTLRRLEWLNRVTEPLNNAISQIAPVQSRLKLIYVSQWVPENHIFIFNNNKLNTDHFAGQEHQASLKLLEQVFWKKQSVMEQAEWRVGHSLVGPHRDDWSFVLGELPLKGHGSQGEIRSALLALKLSELELFRKKTGHRPLFLLDDFSSELDEERRKFLLDIFTETDLQVFVTTTESDFSVGKKYRVSNGVIE